MRRRLATPDEVAEYLQKPVGTLRQWRYLGVGPKYVKLNGRDVRYAWDSVDEWVESQQKAAA